MLFVIEKGLVPRPRLDEAKAGPRQGGSRPQARRSRIRASKSSCSPRNVGSQAKLDEVTAKQGEARGQSARAEGRRRKGNAPARLHGYHGPDCRVASAARPFRSATSSGRRAGSLATIVTQDPIYASFPVTPARDPGSSPAGGSQGARRSDDPSRNWPTANPMQAPGKINFLDVTVNPGHRHGAGPRGLSQSGPPPGRRPAGRTSWSRAAMARPASAPRSRPSSSTRPVRSSWWSTMARRSRSAASRPAPVRGADIIVRKGARRVNERVITEGIQRVVARPRPCRQPKSSRRG